MSEPNAVSPPPPPPASPPSPPPPPPADTKTTTQTPEEKAAAEKEAADKKTADEAAKQPLTLESIKVPDGVELDKEVAGKFVGILNDPNLSPQARAQGLFDLYTETQNAASEKGSKQWDELQTKWTEEAKADPVIGGEKLEPALGSIAKLIDKFSTKPDGTPDPELASKVREAFDLTGMGNHPAVIRLFAGIAKATVEEGKPSPNNIPSGSDRSRAQRLYPEHPTAV